MPDETEDDKPKGGGYALVDWRLSRIESTLAENAKAAVPIGIYNVNQQVITDKLAELLKADAEEAAVRTASDVAITTRLDTFEKNQQANKDAIEKNRKQFWATVAAGALLLVIGIFVNPLSQALSTWGH